jgi:flagellar L-ring protein precursor FlgH
MEAKISAIVKQVLPNGNLVLEGTRQITVNDDVQTITVTGIVRPKDVGANNSVLSIYLADAQIKYVGDGPTAQRPGIITRILQTPFHWVAGIFRRIF